jgi:hypothetical protein
LIEDVNNGEGAPQTRPFFRAAWYVRAISVCPLHRTEIMAFELTGGEVERLDFSNLVWERWSQVETMAKESPRRNLVQFDSYFTDRMHGVNRPSEILHPLPFLAALRLCEIIGHIRNRPPTAKVALSDSVSRRRDFTVGYGTLAGGFDSLRSFLEEMLATRKQARGWMLSDLRRLLAKNADKEEFEMLIRFFTDFSVSSDRAAELFGSRAKFLFSENKERETNIAASGKGSPPKKSRTTLLSLRYQINVETAALKMGVRTADVIDLLEESVLKSYSRKAGPYSIISSREVAGLIARVLDRAQGNASDPDLTPLREMARENRFSNIIRGILEGIIVAARTSDDFSLSGLLVHAMQSLPPTRSVPVVALAFNVSSNAIRALIRLEELPSVGYEAKPQIVSAAFDTFRKIYISENDIRKGDQFRWARDNYEFLTPAFDFGKGDRIYRISDLTPG